jgi:PhnB protein
MTGMIMGRRSHDNSIEAWGGKCPLSARASQHGLSTMPKGVNCMGGIPLPEGYHSVNPYIVVDDAERLIDFLSQVFGAVEQRRSLRPDGRIDHGDVRIGDSLVMLSEASEAYPSRPCAHFVYVPDVDATYRAALAAGATSILEPTEQSWGDRVCGFVDPFDNRWWVATHLREFS